MTKTLYQNEQQYNETQLKICKETVMISFIVAYMQKNHYLINEVNLKIEALQTNGIMVNWINHQLMSYKHRQNKSPSSGPEVMKIENLRGAFDILILGLLTCFLCFAFEIAVDQIQRTIESYTHSVLVFSL